MSQVKRNSLSIRKNAVAVQLNHGPDADQYTFPAQLKPVSKPLISLGPAQPPRDAPGKVPLYCNQQGNEDRLFKAPIEDFHFKLDGKPLADGKRLSLSDLVGFHEPKLVPYNAYPFEKGLKSAGGRPLFPSVL